MFTNKKLLSKREWIQKMVSVPSIELTPEEADQFLTYLIDQSVLKNNARIERMAKNEKLIRALGFGAGRFLKPAGTFVKATHAKTDFSQNKITLTSKKVKGCVPVYDDDLEDIGDGAAFKANLMKLVAAKIANELDEAAYISDTHDLGGFGDTDIRSIWDGWRYQITNSGEGKDYHNDVSGAAVVIDAEGAKIVEREVAAPYDFAFMYADALKQLDSMYKTVGLSALRFWNNDQITTDYMNSLAKRGTALGDSVITGKISPVYNTVPIVSCPLMPLTLDSAGVLDGNSGENYTDVLLTPGQNLIIGLQRELTIEADRNAAEDCTDMYYTMRACFAIENINACVLIKNLVVA